MSALYDVAAIGNAIVDVIAPADDAFLCANNLAKGAMTLIDEGQAQALYARMAPGLETSGGSAGNTIAGVASLGGRAAYVGKVANDQLGEVFAHDMRALAPWRRPKSSPTMAHGRRPRSQSWRRPTTSLRTRLA
jgi:sugar/nucleoside kinase (ribokinase family)